MSLQPIDLQTLFAQLSQVSSKQAALRDGLIQNQTVVGNEIIRRSVQEQHSVTQSDEVADGPENVHDDDESQKKGEGRKEKRRKESGEERKQEVFREPYLGKNVDLSG